MAVKYTEEQLNSVDKSFLIQLLLQQQEQLEAEFGVNGWKQLPDAISRKYHFVPARVEVEEHHIL